MQFCYLCGSSKNLTRDHIPPRGFFDIPRPQNLITVPCCNDCNHKFSEDDKNMRSWLTTVHKRSAAGKWVFENKVCPEIDRPNKKMLNHLVEGKRILTFTTQGISVPVRAISYPDEVVERFMIRITKGLLRNFYSKYDYSKDKFHLVMPPPSRENLEFIRGIAKDCFRDSRGVGVFDFWRNVSKDNIGGVWIIIFYDQACFVITHSSKFPDSATSSARALMSE